MVVWHSSRQLLLSHTISKKGLGIDYIQAIHTRKGRRPELLIDLQAVTWQPVLGSPCLEAVLLEQALFNATGDGAAK